MPVCGSQPIFLLRKNRVSKLYSKTRSGCPIQKAEGTLPSWTSSTLCHIHSWRNSQASAIGLQQGLPIYHLSHKEKGIYRGVEFVPKGTTHSSFIVAQYSTVPVKFGHLHTTESLPIPFALEAIIYILLCSPVRTIFDSLYFWNIDNIVCNLRKLGPVPFTIQLKCLFATSGCHGKFPMGRRDTFNMHAEGFQNQIVCNINHSAFIVPAHCFLCFYLPWNELDTLFCTFTSIIPDIETRTYVRNC